MDHSSSLRVASRYFMGLILLLAVAIAGTSCSDDDDAPPPPSPPPTVPVVATNPVGTFTVGTALVGGNVTSTGGRPVTRRGVSWGFEPSPGLNDNVVELGTGTGGFNTTLTDLSGGTTYHVRAFAENEVGIAWGESRSFTTQGEIGGLSTPGSGVTDMQGRTYPTVIINQKEWMAANLRTELFANGDALEEIQNNTAWNTATIPAWSSYLNSAELAGTYGYLYNFAAVSDPRGLCPAGWHVPTVGEWQQLVAFLGGETQAGGKIKETGIANWQQPNTGASNASGFNGRPSGQRSSFGGFNDLGTVGAWWSNGNIPGGIAAMYVNNTTTAAELVPVPQVYGLAVRCVKD